LAGAVAWQATITSVIGSVVGIPIGIIVGRQLWTLFARSISAVPDPTVPAPTVALVGVGARFFAILVATLSGRRAATAPTALILRSEDGHSSGSRSATILLTPLSRRQSSTRRAQLAPTPPWSETSGGCMTFEPLGSAAEPASSGATVNRYTSGIISGCTSTQSRGGRPPRSASS
jgi:hypothetical protein